MKVMPYTDPRTKAVYPASAWVPLVIAIDHQVQEARVVFLGYATAAAANEHAKPIASKEYTLKGSNYMAMAGRATTGAPLLWDLSEAAYDLAEAVLDTERDGEPGLVSFFHGAADVEYLG